MNTSQIVNGLGPDEMIRANGQAEAEEATKLREEINSYDQQLSELRALYQKNNALVERLERMNEETTNSVQTILTRDTTKEEDTPKLDPELFHKKVEESIMDSKEQISELLQQSDEFSHRENVRVYRNIQASMIAELDKQTQELQGAMIRLKNTQNTILDNITHLGETLKPKKSPLPVLTFIGVVAILVLQILQVSGVFTNLF